MPEEVDLRADDIACRLCGKRARPGYEPTTEPCWAGDTTESDHDWVEYGGLTDA